VLDCQEPSVFNWKGARWSASNAIDIVCMQGMRPGILGTSGGGGRGNSGRNRRVHQPAMGTFRGVPRNHQEVGDNITSSSIWVVIVDGLNNC